MLTIEQHKDLKALVDISTAEKLREDSVWNSLSREAYVVGGGLLDGFKENATSVKLIEKSPDIAVSMGLGTVLAHCNKKAGMLKLAAQVTGLAFTAAFVKDVAKPERLDNLSRAAVNAWNSPAQLDENRALVKQYGGDFLFDTTIMAAGGIAGAATVRALPSYRSDNLRSLFGTKAEALKKPPGQFSMPPRSMEVRTMTLGAVSESKVSSYLPPWEVLPEGAGKASPHGRKLPADAERRPIAELENADRLTWKLDNGHEIEWVPAKDSVPVRLEAQNFVEHFMNGRYDDALRVAIESPVMQRVDLNPATRTTEVRINAGDLKQPETVRLAMSALSEHAQFKWQQQIRDGVMGEQKLQVVVPRTVVQLQDGKTLVPLVDFAKRPQGGYMVEFPEKTTSGRALTATESTEIGAIRQSAEGQRLLAETALFGFEESIVHANQHITNGGRISSPSFAQFAREFASANKTRGHQLAFLGMIDSRHPLRETLFEQEVPALLVDAGMPLSVVRHHFFFGGRHVNVRTPVINFLEAREASPTNL